MKLSKTKPTLVESFAVNLKVERRGARLTQEQLAERAGLSVAYVSILERAGRTAPLNTVERFARVLGVQPHALLLPPTPARIAAAHAP
jgi:transcriptional regulator with XRE-family HTH domain